MKSNIVLPRHMRMYGGAFADTGELLASLGLSRPLIVTDTFISKSGLADKLVSQMEAAGLSNVRIFDGVVPDPTTKVVEAGVTFLKEANHDCVVGLGGGSAIDTAKAVAVLSRFPGSMKRYKAPHMQDVSGLPLVAIPTTAGTGAEATRFTVVTDSDTDEKMLCVGQAYLPIAAVVDYRLTMSMPPRLTADTGIDALTHAIEAYVSRRANDFSDGMAFIAMGKIAKNLRAVFQEPDNVAARRSVMVGATQAGIAFSNSSVALVHGMSRPIGAHFHVPHGLSNAMLLPTVTAYSMGSAVERYADCAHYMGLKTGKTSTEGAFALLQELISLNRDLQVPSPKKYGIDKNQWDAVVKTMAQQAIASGSPDNNPRIPTAGEIVELYEQAYLGVVQ